MSENNDKCPLCGSSAQATKQIYGTKITDYVECPTCGNYAIERFLDKIPEAPQDKSKLASFLFYKRHVEKHIRSYYIGSRAVFEQTKADDEPFTPVGADPEARHPGMAHYEWLGKAELEAWYPRTFSEKVDMFLLGLAQMSKYVGADVLLLDEANGSALFVRRHDNDSKLLPIVEVRSQVEYMRVYMTKTDEYVKTIRTGANDALTAKVTGSALAGSSRVTTQDSDWDHSAKYRLLPKGLKRVDELQRDRGTHSKDVFVAMSFETDVPEVKKLREDIEAAIVAAKYNPLLMDKLPHNGQIVPEMLLQIRQARFVIADFTFPNHGAYYEAGYALGQGKQVIHICQKDVFDKKDDKDKKMHFDVAQINTIVWVDEADLKRQLVKRIEATITQAQ